VWLWGRGGAGPEEVVQELTDGKNADLLEGIEREEILIACEDDVGATSNRALEDAIVIGIAAYVQTEFWTYDFRVREGILNGAHHASFGPSKFSGKRFLEFADQLRRGELHEGRSLGRVGEAPAGSVFGQER
jgi:hypothetical protein